MLAVGSRRASARAIAVGLLLVATFVASLVVGRSLFSLHSINHDDAMYVYVAQMLGDGDLTLSAEEHDFFTPWASGVHGDRVVMKYAPPWPAVLAVSQGVSGSTALASATAAAAAVGLVFLLAREIFPGRHVALLAAAAFALSPIALIQSGTALPYLFQLVTGLAFATALVAGTRRERPGLIVGAGVALGVGLFARPFDAVVFAAPFVAVLAWQERRRPRELARALARLGAGAAPVVALSLLYNAHTMGSPLSLPFTVTGPLDTFGFGRRGVFADRTIDFSLGDGWDGLTENLRWLVTWTFGGLVTVALAVVGLVATGRTGWRRSPWTVALVGVVVTTCVGYVMFWSPFAMSTLWPGVQTLGPYYHLALLVPLAILGARGLDLLWRRSRATRVVAAAALLGGVALTVTAIPPKIEANAAVRDGYADADREIDALGLANAVLVMPGRGKDGFLSSTPFLENRPDLDQPVLFAEDRGPGNFALFDRFPDRRIHQLVQQLEPGDELMEPSLVPTELRIERGGEVAVDVGVRNPTVHPQVTLTVGDGETERRRVVDTASALGREYAASWRISADPGATGEDVFVPHPTDGGLLTFGLAVGSAEQPDLRWQRRVPYRVVDGRVELIRPGTSFSSYTHEGELRWLAIGTDDVFAEGPLPRDR